MSHQLLTAAGYSLPVVPARDATSLLQQAICATWAATHRTYASLPPLYDSPRPPSRLASPLLCRWPRDVIALRNAHLAAELVQRAISNRNKRMALPRYGTRLGPSGGQPAHGPRHLLTRSSPSLRLLCAPLALSEADLGVESEGLQSLLAKRREVEEEVSQLVT